MPPAAPILSLHVCPMVTPGVPPIPHVGGPVIGPGAPQVLIAGQPAAVVGDTCVCVGPPDAIAMGSSSVLIGGKPAARVGDSTVHGGPCCRRAFPTSSSAAEPAALLSAFAELLHQQALGHLLGDQHDVLQLEVLGQGGEEGGDGEHLVAVDPLHLVAAQLVEEGLVAVQVLGEGGEVADGDDGGDGAVVGVGGGGAGPDQAGVGGLVDALLRAGVPELAGQGQGEVAVLGQGEQLGGQGAGADGAADGDDVRGQLGADGGDEGVAGGAVAAVVLLAEKAVAGLVDAQGNAGGQGGGGAARPVGESGDCGCRSRGRSCRGRRGWRRGSRSGPRPRG